jgi:hypothetical protein
MRFWLLCVFLWGCSATTHVSRVPHVTLTVHADAEFDYHDRQVIARAVNELNTSVGCQISVVYDLDGGTLETLRFATRMRKAHSDEWLVKDLDRKVGGITFGWFSLTGLISIVRDRLWTDQMLEHVVLHELMHSLGTDHVRDPRAVMYGQTDYWHQAIRLNDADKRAVVEAAKKILPVN